MEKRMASDAPSGRHPIRESAILGWYILRNWFLHDLLTLFDLLQQQKIKPLIAQRLPLCQARHAHELLGSGGVIGKIVLTPNG
jgi:NADPH2:quinone reductase